MEKLNLKPDFSRKALVSRRSMRAAPRFDRQADEKMSYASDVKTALIEKGYNFTPSEDVRFSLNLRPELHTFLSECMNLPVDPYCVEGTRERRHTRLILLPWKKQLLRWPKNGYFQDSTINPDAAGVAREFEPFTETMLNNGFLRQAILTDFNLTPFASKDLQQPFDVGLHAIKTVPRVDQPAVASPNCLHKDTEPFTFIHLLQRENIIGGENIITDNVKEPLFIATLTHLMDTLVVRDDAVYHHVMPINLENPRAAGFRTVLLIDFTPMRSAVNQYN
jgi:hypothetical protein